jgi:3-methyl-2-oxobutanoate hydroxymethyltransferase
MSGYLQDNQVQSRRKKVTIPSLLNMRESGEKITMLTCYDASFASLMDRCGVDMLLVGDSLGNVIQGRDTTLPVSIQAMVYHTSCVARGNQTAMLVADLPFGTYPDPRTAYANAVKLMQAGAHMVKLEGGEWLADTIRYLTQRGIPVIAHIGLTPQYVHQLGGFKVQGKNPDGAERLKAEALSLQKAGAALILLEAIPAVLAKELTELLDVPTIGIGAGPDCSGQVLVMHDMLGVFPGKTARFVRNFMDGQPSIEAAIKTYVGAVKDLSFPASEHCF